MQYISDYYAYLLINLTFKLDIVMDLKNYKLYIPIIGIWYCITDFEYLFRTEKAAFLLQIVYISLIIWKIA